MTPKLKKRLIHLVAYPAFFMAAFTALFFVNFPYDALKERLVSEARQKDIEIAIDEISPTLLGIEARGHSLEVCYNRAMATVYTIKRADGNDRATRWSDIEVVV